MKVLVAPLDWGLGHATRCVPLIRALQAAGHEVIPCASGAGLRLLRAEFPGLETRALPSYAMRYTRRRALLPLWLFLQLPLFLFSAWRDRRAAARIARETGAGLIVSDGRYGFHGAAAGGPAAIPSIFVSHQLDILPPGPRALRALIAPALRALNRRALRPYREVWVPDFPGTQNLSGTLGHPDPSAAKGLPPLRYIRPLCRFRPEDMPWDRAFLGIRNASQGTTEPLRIDTLAVLSGPEPQRTLLEEILIRAFADLPGTRVIVRGVPPAVPAGLKATAGPQNSVFEIHPNSITIFDHLSQDRLLTCLMGADRVVCRSGYTTMMELAGLGKGPVLLVPTPGQPEQEYLAVHAQAAGLAAWRDQDRIRGSADIEAGLREAGSLPGFSALFGEAREGFDLTSWIRSHCNQEGC